MSKKTTILGYIALAVLAIAFVALMLEKVTLTEITNLLAPLSVFLTAIIGWISKDYDK